MDNVMQATYWLDQKYINLIAFRLERFKQRNNGYNFRCPLCGDSARSKSKTRGSIKSLVSISFIVSTAMLILIFLSFLRR